MSAYGGTHINARVPTVSQRRDGLLIKPGGLWQAVGVLDLGLRESSDENTFAIPRGLEDFAGRKLGDVDFLVGVPDVSG